MKAYISITRMRFIALLQYRMAAAAGAFTQLFFGLVMSVIMREFFFSGTQVQPMTPEQAVSYIWLGQAMLRMLPWDGDDEVMQMMRDGNIAYELCRPLQLYDHWYFRLIALRTAPTLLRALPVFALSLLLPAGLGLHLPSSGAAFLAWIIATLGALLLGCAISNIISISALWTVAGDGMRRLLPALVILMSGMIVPLPLFPDWAQGILQFLPFAGLVDLPNQFWVGTLEPGMAIPMLLRQLAWTVAIVMLGRVLVARATRRVVIQGG